jgi:iron complex outermembrane receptor protein
MTYTKSSLYMASAIAALIAPLCAAAQTTPAPSAPPVTEAQSPPVDPNEIIVTARRVAEPLQTTPVAVTALGDNMLRAAAATNVGDVGKLVPNLTLVGGRGLAGQGFVFLRGVGQTDDNPATDPGVAQYIDDVYIGRTQGTQFDFNDIASIEVLRGPQGTIYGKNAIGGAVKINSKLPDNTPRYSFRFGYGNYNDIAAVVGISQPLIENNLYFSVSGQVHKNTGFQQNLVTGRNDMNADTYSGRFILRYKPEGAPFDIWLAADGTHDMSRTYNPRIVALNPANAIYLASRNAGIDITPYVLAPGADPFRGGGFDTSTDAALGDPQSELNVWGVSLHASYDFGSSQIKSITAYRNLFSRRLSDTDGAGVPYINSLDFLNQHQFSQELQFSGDAADKKLTWLGGLYYYREHFDTNSLTDYLRPINPNAAFNRFFSQTAQSYAAFLNLGYEIVDGLRINVGGRYTHEQKDIETFTTVLNKPNVILFPLTGRTAKFNDFSPKVIIDYRVTNDVFLYASASKGFKSGGFNGRANLNQALDPVGSEKVWSYEAGFKTKWFDRRLTINLAGFTMDYRDIQEQVFAPRTDGIAGVVSVVLNAARARIKGFELETSLRPVNGVTLSGNLGYVDAHYSAPFINNGVAYTNNALPLTPKWNGRVAANFDGRLSDGATGSLNIGYSFRSRTELDVPNTPALSQKPYGLLDARAGIGFGRGIEIAVFGKNLTNTVYKATGADFLGSLGADVAWFGPPRTYGVELSWKF